MHLHCMHNDNEHETEREAALSVIDGCKAVGKGNRVPWVCMHLCGAAGEYFMCAHIGQQVKSVSNCER